MIIRTASKLLVKIVSGKLWSDARKARMKSPLKSQLWRESAEFLYVICL